MARPIKDRLKIRIRTDRELIRYVIGTTALCVALALACDVANQLYFFESWPAALRSWAMTVGIVLTVAVPVSLALGKANLALYEASRTDPLTGLLNRRALLESADGCPAFMALVIVDVDRFKQVNDQHGHLAGDEVLRVIAQLMTAALGDVGRIGRMGGEEFALLASRSDPETIRGRLDAFRSQIAVTPVVAGVTAVSVTISAGLATRGANEPFEQLYARADRALYMAKASGRNRIVSADELDIALAGATGRTTTRGLEARAR